MNIIDYCLTILVSSFHRVSSVHGLVLGCLLFASFIAGTKVFGGLGNFKEKLRLLDSLVPDTDKLPETVRITFLKEAVQQNPDLRQIHVLDSLCKYKERSTGQLTFELYFDLLWNAASQHDLNKDTKTPPKKGFISDQYSPPDDLEYEYDETDYTCDQDQDDPYPIQFFNPLPPTIMDLKESNHLIFPHMNGSNSLHL